MRTIVLSLVLAAFVVAPVGAGTIKAIDLAAGRTDENGITEPVFDAADVAPIVIGAITSDVGTDQKVAEKLSWTAPPSQTLQPQVAPGSLLADALRSEGASLGLPVRGEAPATGAWQVSGNLGDLLVEMRAIPFGPIIFYGTLEATFTVESPEGETTEHAMRFVDMTARYNAGMGVEDEISEALAELILEAGQEAMARMNRRLFRAPVRSEMATRAQALVGRDVDGHESEVRTIGLSGTPEALDPLLTVLRQEENEDDRVHVVRALGNLGQAEAVPVLIERYPTEEGEVRYAILAALDTLGGEEAAALIRKEGTKDDLKAAKNLARRITR